MRNRISTLLLAASTTFGPSQLLAQWASQTIDLHDGWNAIYLEVQPEPRDSATVFADLPIESVWMWNRRFTPVQYIQNPDTLVPEDPDWLTYFAPHLPLADNSNLHDVLGGKCYLLNVSSGSSTPLRWTVKGQPVLRSPDWVADSYNPVGFPVNASSPAHFQTFFAPSTHLRNGPIYRLVAGLWERVNDPAATTMRAGEAFWIKATGVPNFAGPIEVDLETPGRLEFGRTVIERTVKLRNTSSEARILTVTLLPSEAPPLDARASLAGPVALSYWDDDLVGEHFGWFELTDRLTFAGVAPGQEVLLRLAVRRQDMGNDLAGTGDLPGFQSLLEVKDDAGTSRYLVPVTARGLTEALARPELGFRPAASGGQVAAARAGLWVGNAVIRAVSYSADPSDSTNAIPTATELRFRLILHLDTSGEAKLLQHVTMLWQNGQLDEQGNVVREGEFVLVSDDSLLEQYQGATIRNGQRLGRRISTVCFGFDEPQSMDEAGEFGGEGGRLTCSVFMDYEDPLNPFKHRFHPDHNNLGEDYSTSLAEGVESYSVTRDLTLSFTAQDPSGVARSIAGWGDNQVGGIYRETVLGVHKKPLYLLGTFRLHRASRIGVLQDSRIN